MKYLVNRETKEHIVYHEEHSLPLKGWDIVQADSEGWIPWNGDGVCPLRGNDWCDYKCDDGRGGKGRAYGLVWSHGNSFTEDITDYRPILTEQSEPETPSELQPHSVFDRLRTATEHASSIPSIIAEIDELLGPEYQVVRVEKIEATAPQEDMSDWRNWRPGDLVRRVSPSSPSIYTAGNLYAVHSVDDGAVRIHDDCGANSFCYFQEDAAEKFTFHSRPSGVTK